MVYRNIFNPQNLTLGLEKTVVAEVMSELKLISQLKGFLDDYSCVRLRTLIGLSHKDS